MMYIVGTIAWYAIGLLAALTLFLIGAEMLSDEARRQDDRARRFDDERDASASAEEEGW